MLTRALSDPAAKFSVSFEWRSCVTTSTEEHWESLTSAVARALGDLGKGDFMIIARRHVNHFVQVAGTTTGAFRIEAVSNTYIEPPSAALTVEQYCYLTELGWRRATDDAPELVAKYNDPNGSPNFFIDVPAGTSVRQVAALLICTLREVYGIEGIEQLHYQAFSNSHGEFCFPDMPIRRRC